MNNGPENLTLTAQAVLNLNKAIEEAANLVVTKCGYLSHRDDFCNLESAVSTLERLCQLKAAGTKNPLDTGPVVE